jgi:hypothetical protein
MNPAYPPYPQQQQYAPHPSPQMNPSGPGIPGHHPPPPHQYSYPYPPPPPHYHQPYQYSQPMMVYAPRPSAQPETPQDPSSPPQSAPPNKRKRKSTGDGRKNDKSDDENGASGSDMGAQQRAQAIVDMKKRTKTVGGVPSASLIDFLTVLV